jgi:predicted nucleic acid-binding protein
LLDQEKREICKEFLTKNQEHINISDFTLYSIAIVLFKGRKFNDYLKFQQTVIENMTVRVLPTEYHSQIAETSNIINLDFDDAYQYNTAKFYELKIITMDKDFRKIKDVDVIFL